MNERYLVRVVLSRYIYMARVTKLCSTAKVKILLSGEVVAIESQFYAGTGASSRLTR